MASNLAKAAAVGALAIQNGGGGGGGVENDNNNNNNNNKILPACPNTAIPHYHEPDVCRTKPSHPTKGHAERESIYERLRDSGTGATLVPNQKTVVCPIVAQSLESPTAQKGFDTTWIVENTASVEVVISWVVNGVEWSPFEPDIKAIDDPKARLQPGDWQSIPTFESFVYTVREVMAGGFPGDVLLQHRVGLIPMGNPMSNNEQQLCETIALDNEPVDPETAERDVGFKRTPTHEIRPCNTIDIGFRNEVGCPLDVYWGRLGTGAPKKGFNCDEKFKFHLGTKPAPQDFMFDWDSYTKFEGAYMGHTFVARLTSNHHIVVDSYTLEPTKIIDCPKVKKQTVAVSSQSHREAEVVIGAEGTVQPLPEEQLVDVDSDTTMEASAATGGLSS